MVKKEQYTASDLPEVTHEIKGLTLNL